MVEYLNEDSNSAVYLETYMVVPPEQPSKGTTFLWPGLTPSDANMVFERRGVLQPVLTWGGPSCAPGDQPPLFSSWFISGLYVFLDTNIPNFWICKGGPIMNVIPGDILKLQFDLKGNTWTLTMTSLASDKNVTFSYNLGGDRQNRLVFDIELYGADFKDDIIFLNSK